MQPLPDLLVLRYAAALLIGLYMVRQVKKPDRFAGRLFASLMNKSHAPLTDWAFSQLGTQRVAMAMDVGCGAGRTIHNLAEIAEQIYGIDYAAGSVAACRAHNRELIAEGRAHVERASVSQLPFPDNNFDLVTNTLDTQFRIGSMNKMFTATAILQLAGEGKLDLAAPLSRYLPDYPNHEADSKVTIRHLLTHTGGAGDIFTPKYEKHRLGMRELAECLSLRACAQRVRCQRRTRWQNARWATCAKTALG